VVLRTVLPTPDSFAGAGLNNHTSMLEVWTEFISAPEPQIKADTTPGVTDDLLLDFGAMKISVGKAFATQPAQGVPAAVKGAHVLKRWVTINNREFLIEQIPYEAISNAVQNLPPHASIPTPGAGSIKNTASLLPLRPRQLTTTTPPVPMKVAKSAPDGPGLVIDYSVMGASATNYLFQGDTTYYISSAVNLYGTNVFEPGTVVNYTNSSSSYIYLDDTTGSFAFNGTHYRPTVYTDMNDNSVGDTINYSTGAPSMNSASFLLSLQEANLTVSHARISYAYWGCTAILNYPVTLTDCQFVQCGYCLDSYSATTPVYLHNVLASQCFCVVYCPYCAIRGENITADSCSYFSLDASSAHITNSIFTAVGVGGGFTFDHSVVVGSAANMYQTVGNGNYYLANGSTNQGTGTTNIDAATLGDLQTMTTYPPQVFSNQTISVSTNLGIAAPRDPGITGLDKGYHY
jgi:hypothetical protein